MSPVIKMDLTQLNNVNCLTYIHPIKKFELEVGHTYRITELKKKLWESMDLIAVLNDEFTLFLPTRTNNDLLEHEKKLKQLSDLVADGALNLLFQGTKYNKFEFVC